MVYHRPYHIVRSWIAGVAVVFLLQLLVVVVRVSSLRVSLVEVEQKPSFPSSRNVGRPSAFKRTANKDPSITTSALQNLQNTICPGPRPKNTLAKVENQAQDDFVFPSPFEEEEKKFAKERNSYVRRDPTNDDATIRSLLQYASPLATASIPSPSTSPLNKTTSILPSNSSTFPSTTTTTTNNNNINPLWFDWPGIVELEFPNPREVYTCTGTILHLDLETTHTAVIITSALCIPQELRSSDTGSFNWGGSHTWLGNEFKVRSSWGGGGRSSSTSSSSSSASSSPTTTSLIIGNMTESLFVFSRSPGYNIALILLELDMDAIHSLPAPLISYPWINADIPLWQEGILLGYGAEKVIAKVLGVGNIQTTITTSSGAGVLRAASAYITDISYETTYSSDCFTPRTGGELYVQDYFGGFNTARPCVNFGDDGAPVFMQVDAEVMSSSSSSINTVLIGTNISSSDSVNGSSIHVNVSLSSNINTSIASTTSSSSLISVTPTPTPTPTPPSTIPISRWAIAGIFVSSSGRTACDGLTQTLTSLAYRDSWIKFMLANLTRKSAYSLPPCPSLRPTALPWPSRSPLPDWATSASSSATPSPSTSPVIPKPLNLLWIIIMATFFCLLTSCTAYWGYSIRARMRAVTTRVSPQLVKRSSQQQQISSIHQSLQPSAVYTAEQKRRASLLRDGILLPNQVRRSSIQCQPNSGEGGGGEGRGENKNTSVMYVKRKDHSHHPHPSEEHRRRGSSMWVFGKHVDDDRAYEGESTVSSHQKYRFNYEGHKQARRNSDHRDALWGHRDDIPVVMMMHSSAAESMLTTIDGSSSVGALSHDNHNATEDHRKDDHGGDNDALLLLEGPSPLVLNMGRSIVTEIMP